MSRPRRGARSILGAMSTYTKVAFAVLPVMALLLWAALTHEPPRPWVELAAEGPWVEASLDDGRAPVLISAGERLELPPGTYRATLFDGRGRSVTRQVRVELPGTRFGVEP